MDEIEPIKWMILVLDSAIHMDAADFAGVALYGRCFVDNCEFVLVRRDTNAVSGHHRNQRKRSSFRFSALAATTGVLMDALRIYCDLNWIRTAVTVQISTGKVVLSCLDTIINCRMFRGCGRSFSPGVSLSLFASHIY